MGDGERVIHGRMEDGSMEDESMEMIWKMRAENDMGMAFVYENGS